MSMTMPVIEDHPPRVWWLEEVNFGPTSNNRGSEPSPTGLVLFGHTTLKPAYLATPTHSFSPIGMTQSAKINNGED